MIAVLGAFLAENRVWNQRDLALRLGLTVPAVRNCLRAMREQGIPFEREQEERDVYWSLPKGWVPGAVAFGSDEVHDLLSTLERSVRTDTRDRLIRRVLAALPAGEGRGGRAVVDTPTLSGEEGILGQLEDAARRKMAVHARYRSGSSVVSEWRHLSPQQVSVRERARVAAVCHRSGELRWFRLDGFERVSLDPAVRWRPADDEALRRFVAESLDGFREGDRRAVSFVVRAADALWVQRNLPGEALPEGLTDGSVRFRFETAGVLALARFVAGLGGSLVRIETPELALRVAEIARGALRATDAEPEADVKDRGAGRSDQPEPLLGDAGGVRPPGREESMGRASRRGATGAERLRRGRR